MLILQAEMCMVFALWAISAFKTMYTVSDIYETLSGIGRSYGRPFPRRKAIGRLACGSLLLACSCSSPQSDSETVSGQVDEAESGETSCPESPAAEEEAFVADNDIAMTVRSMACAISEGEPLDSTDYNFSGVLTDGMGAPLFTDFKGFPGQWEVDVVNPHEVLIRNIGTGDLMPGELMAYLASTFNTSAYDDDEELRMVDAFDEGEAQVTLYSFGHTSLRVETRPETLPTGEVGPKLQITLRYDTIGARQHD